MSSYQSQKSRNRQDLLLAALGTISVVYLAIVIAPYAQEGIPGLLQHYAEIDFLHPHWFSDTPKTIGVCLLIYGFAVMVAIASRHKYHRRGVEHGSADWGDVRKLRKEFHAAACRSVVYTRHFGISYEPKDLYRHKRNLNCLVVGGPGSGKTRGYVYPNLLHNTGDSFVVLDPKGEIVRTTGKFLLKNGTKVKVLDLINPNRSWGYNPFVYIKSDDDVQRLVTAIFAATTQKSAQTQDPFWDEAGKILLSALMYLLYYFGLPTEQNFPFVLDLLRAGRIDDSEDDTQQSALDLLFSNVRSKYPDHICVRYYNDYRGGAGKTLQSVQITLLARLQKFELGSIGGMMQQDELELDQIGDEPTALFCVIPDNDSSYNFIISLLYIQLFQSLFRKADQVYRGPLPRFVHVIMDEFPSVYTPDDFLSTLATCRSRNCGISIIVQNLAQLKARYKEGWENILGQCDELLYLGGNEPSTHEQISKMLGKETIDTNTYGRRYGQHGDYSANYQISGRELLTPEEVRALPYEQAILLVKNAPPLVDKKISVTSLPAAKETPLCGDKSKEYHYGLRADRITVEHLSLDPGAPVESSLEEMMESAPHTELWHMDLYINGQLTADPQELVAQWVQAYDLTLDETN